MANLSGNGPKHRLIFNGDENGYEIWETKFIAHLHLKDLGEVIDQDAPADDEELQLYHAGNKKIYSELVLLLDDLFICDVAGGFSFFDLLLGAVFCFSFVSESLLKDKFLC